MKSTGELTQKLAFYILELLHILRNSLFYYRKENKEAKMDKELKQIIERYETEHPENSIDGIYIDAVKEEAERLLYLCLKEGWLEDALEKVRREADELMDEIIRKSNFK